MSPKPAWEPTVETFARDESAAQLLLDRVRSRSAVVCVVGMGYVGLPLAMVFAEEGFRVLGFDTDPDKVALLNAATSYIEHIPSARIKAVVDSARMEATAAPERLSQADAILICVPTPLTVTRDPDMQYVEQTAEVIASALRPGQLIVLESTTYPGTTEELVRPILERTGLRCGRDYFLAYSPEREDPGNPRFSAGTIPKVVGGTTPACLELAATLYGAVVPEVVRVQSTQVAEATKQLENIFRAVNVGLVNELKILFQRMGIDIWEVIEAASTKPFGFMSFKPGPGLGGHCLPIDPFYLAWKARQYDLPTRFIELAGEINSSMPGYVVSRVGEALNEHAKCLRGAKILLLGMAYKPNVDDLRESPALKLIELLRQQGADVAYNDPHISRLHKMRHYDLDLASVPLTAETLADSDCVLIVTDHDKYDWDFVVRHAKLIVDTRNATRGVSQGREKIRFA